MAPGHVIGSRGFADLVLEFALDVVVAQLLLEFEVLLLLPLLVLLLDFLLGLDAAVQILQERNVPLSVVLLSLILQVLGGVAMLDPTIVSVLLGQGFEVRSLLLTGPGQLGPLVLTLGLLLILFVPGGLCEYLLAQFLSPLLLFFLLQGSLLLLPEPLLLDFLEVVLREGARTRLRSW